MSPHNNLNLIFFSFYLIIISFHLGTCLELSPDDITPSPSPSPVLSPSPSPSPSPSLSSPSPSPGPGGSYPSHVSIPPSTADPPSSSISPDTNEHSGTSGPNFDFSADVIPADVDPRLKEICDTTDFPTLCLATILPLLEEGRDDVPSAVEAAIGAGITYAQFALSMAKEIADRPGTPPELVSVLHDCKDSFDDAVYNFQKALNAFPERDVGTMNSMLSAVITDVGDCEDAFSGLGTESPMFDYSDKLTNMTSISLALVSLLK